MAPPHAPRHTSLQHPSMSTSDENLNRAAQVSSTRTRNRRPTETGASFEPPVHATALFPIENTSAADFTFRYNLPGANYNNNSSTISTDAVNSQRAAARPTELLGLLQPPSNKQYAPPAYPPPAYPLPSLQHYPFLPPSVGTKVQKAAAESRVSSRDQARPYGLSDTRETPFYNNDSRSKPLRQMILNAQARQCHLRMIEEASFTYTWRYIDNAKKVESGSMSDIDALFMILPPELPFGQWWPITREVSPTNESWPKQRPHALFSVLFVGEMEPVRVEIATLKGRLFYGWESRKAIEMYDRILEATGESDSDSRLAITPSGDVVRIRDRPISLGEDIYRKIPPKPQFLDGRLDAVDFVVRQDLEEQQVAPHSHTSNAGGPLNMPQNIAKTRSSSFVASLDMTASPAATFSSPTLIKNSPEPISLLPLPTVEPIGSSGGDLRPMTYEEVAMHPGLLASLELLCATAIYPEAYFFEPDVDLFDYSNLATFTNNFSSA